jgi:hypothetical protein
MELEFERDTIACWETVADMTLSQEESLESIVPDHCPDILRIVDVCGQAILTGKQAKEGMGVISGQVRACILYQPEGALGLRRMEVSIPFTCQTETRGLTDRGVLLASPKLLDATARALNPRKVLLQVELSIHVTAFQPMEQRICRGVAGGEDICQRQFSGETYQTSAVQEKPFLFTEQVRLPSGKGEAPQILFLRAQPVCTESKLIGNKLIFKGTVDLHLLLQEVGGGISSSHESMAFSQIVEVSEPGEEGDCSVLVELTDMQFQLDPADSHSVSVELALLAQTQVRCRRPITLLQDLYSTARQTEVERETKNLFHLEEHSIRPQAVRELLETGELVRGVIDSRSILGKVTQSRQGDQLVLSVNAWITVLYLDENELVQCIRRMVPVSIRMDCPSEHLCSCMCRCPSEVFAAPSAEGIEVRFTVEFHCTITSKRSITAVKGGRLGEARTGREGERPSMVLRLAAPEEGVWEIAKAYGTTVAQILQANELEEGDLPEGKLLLIPSVR